MTWKRAERFCTNGPKKAYASVAHIKQARRTLNKSKNTKGLRYYLCPHCHYWHFTHAKN